MKAEEDLHRELGFWTALTIGAGTMIGAGIFLLAGVAVDLTGPGAIFSYLFAGLVCVLTAASAAELATGMPTSGGDYFFVSRSLGPALGAISGVGIWLSLTVAVAFYLFGLGEYLSQFLPVTPFWGAFAGGVLLTVLNVIGAKESGRMQVAVVLTLMGILGAFIAFGVFHMERENLAPFLPFGTEPVLGTTALVFVSFLGFVKIAAGAEEVKDPGRNLPRALIGSVLIVTLLYILIVLVIAGVFSQRTIGSVRDPLTAAARTMMGGVGGALIIFAGLLATVSSANASIMASSRINLAMARDRLVPGWFSAIHERLLTPHRAIAVTGLLALCFLLVESLEDLAKIASSLQLYSYAALNVGCVVLRASGPDWYRPSYRTPFYPWAQLFAAASCLGIILYSGPFAQIAVVALIVVSLAWYFVWGRSRVEIDHAVPELRIRWADLKLRAFFRPAAAFCEAVAEEEPVERELDPDGPRRVMVALANPQHQADLLGMARLIAAGREEGGRVMGVHFVRVPIQTPLAEWRRRFRERRVIERTIEDAGAAGHGRGQGRHGCPQGPGPRGPRFRPPALGRGTARAPRPRAERPARPGRGRGDPGRDRGAGPPARRHRGVLGFPRPQRAVRIHPRHGGRPGARPGSPPAGAGGRAPPRPGCHPVATAPGGSDGAPAPSRGPAPDSRGPRRPRPWDRSPGTPSAPCSRPREDRPTPSSAALAAATTVPGLGEFRDGPGRRRTDRI